MFCYFQSQKVTIFRNWLPRSLSLCLEWKFLGYKIVSRIWTLMIFLEIFMMVLYGYSGIFFGTNLRFLVSSLLHHVKGCQWCFIHLSIHMHSGYAHSTRQETDSHFCFRKSPENVLSDNYVTSFLIQEHMFSHFPSSVSRFLIPLLNISFTYHDYLYLIYYRRFSHQIS